MSHEKSNQDGKKIKNPIKTLKEKRAEKKMKKTEIKMKRKPRQKATT